MPGQAPERTVKLLNPDGSTRIQLICQMWIMPNGEQFPTYATSAIFGPIAFTDDDAQWLANQFKEMFRMMDLYH